MRIPGDSDPTEAKKVDTGASVIMLKGTRKFLSLNNIFNRVYFMQISKATKTQERV